MSLKTWVLLLLGVMLAAAVVGFLIDAVRVIAGVAFVGCLIVLLFNAATRKRPSA
jgi:hypothetical protein